MARSCSICARPDRAAIDAALVNGVSARAAAEAFGLHHSAVHRHARAHLSATLAAGAAAHSAEFVQPVAPIGPARALSLDDGTPPPLPLPPYSAAPGPVQSPVAAVPPIAAPTAPLDPYTLACELRDRALAILRAAEHRGDAKTALDAVRASVPLLDRLDRLMPRASADAAPAALAASPEWATVRAALMAALAPFPDARAAVVAALAGGAP